MRALRSRWLHRATDAIRTVPRMLYRSFLPNRRVTMADAAIERFSFDADPVALNELEVRLKRTIWPDEVAAEPWRYGPPSAYMKGFVQYWLERYD
jgi:hypothetical protein